MSRRVTISVPDDVADQLATIPSRQVSAYVTDALRRRRAADDMRATLSAAGHRDYPYDPEGAAQRLADRRIKPEVRDAALARLADSAGRPMHEILAELDRRATR